MRDLEVKTSKQFLTIRVPVALLVHAAGLLPEFEHYDEKTGRTLVPRITDRDEFAEAVAAALRSEEEDGTTPVHKMLDAAFVEAVEQGAEGISMPGDPDYRAKEAD